jgi:hypothetical protein
MGYFRELPNFQYIANFPNQSFNTDYVLTKNIFKRAKLRTDLANSINVFEYYQIVDNERPDQVAAKVYDNSDLDWVILTTNNITNINQQWPLDNNSFYKYLIDKYGSEEELGKVHHHETVEFKDEYGRVVVPGGLQVDPGKNISFDTPEGQFNSYYTSEFPNNNTNYKIAINLNQFIPVYKENIENLFNPMTLNFIISACGGILYIILNTFNIMDGITPLVLFLSICIPMISTGFSIFVLAITLFIVSIVKTKRKKGENKISK